MNVYRVGICERCGKPTVLDEDEFMVHGDTNLQRALGMLDNGMPIEEVASWFCGYCGNYMKLIDGVKTCGCENPRPQ